MTPKPPTPEIRTDAGTVAPPVVATENSRNRKQRGSVTTDAGGTAAVNTVGGTAPTVTECKLSVTIVRCSVFYAKLYFAVVEAQLAARQRDLGRLEAEVNAQDLLLTERKEKLATVSTELATARRLLDGIRK